MAITTTAAIAGPWEGTETVKDGVPHIQNPATPMESPITIALQELWRIGGDSENEGEFFGVIGAATVDAKGNVYLLDRQLSEVKVFSPGGEYLRTIGREGEGPGEFRRPSDLLFTPDGHVGVLQMAPGKIVKLTHDGEPAGVLPMTEEDGSRLQIRSGEGRGEHMVLNYNTMQMSTGKISRTTILAAFDAEGKETVRFHEEKNDMDFANPIVDETKGIMSAWALGHDGRTYAVTTFGEYEIHVWEPDGTPVRVQSREYEHLMRSGQEKKDMKSRFIIRGPMQPKIVVSDHHPDINRIYPRQDGSLWVQTSRGMKESSENSLGMFDVFNSEGRFVRQVTLTGQGDPVEDLFFLVGDRVFVVTQFATTSAAMFGGRDDRDAEETDLLPMEVICYALPQIASN